jgi:acetyltransferase-like isoleucine patch superfamily enzyme
MPSLRPLKILKSAFRRVNRIARILRFSLLSTNDRVSGKPHRNQPVQYLGAGTISFAENVKIGVYASPGFWSTYCYIESRGRTASIHVGKNTWINNGFSAIAEKRSIKIGENCLIGHDVFIIDSNFHCLDPVARHRGGHVSVGDVEIMNNVFIGSRVTILKNTRIGSGSVVAAGSLVSGHFPSNCVIAGNPALVIRQL